MGTTSIWVAVAAVAVLALGLLLFMPGSGGDPNAPAAVDNLAPADQIQPALPADTITDGTDGTGG